MQAFSQTLKTGLPEGLFSHKIIRDKVNFPCISFKNWPPKDGWTPFWLKLCKHALVTVDTGKP